MQTPVRYYITCDDDRPVVRTIPVAVQAHEPVTEQAPSADLQEKVAGQAVGEKPRVTKRALSKARRLRNRADRA